VVTAADLVVADARHHRDEPPVAVDHVLMVILEERQERLRRSPVVVGQIAADEGEVRVLSGGEDVCADGVRPDPAVATRNELQVSVALAGMVRKRYSRAAWPIWNLYSAPAVKPAMIAAKDFQIGVRERFGDGLSDLPDFAFERRVVHDRVGDRLGPDPLDRDCRRRIAAPCQEKRTAIEKIRLCLDNFGLARRFFGKEPRAERKGQRREFRSRNQETCGDQRFAWSRLAT